MPRSSRSRQPLGKVRTRSRAQTSIKAVTTPLVRLGSLPRNLLSLASTHVWPRCGRFPHSPSKRQHVMAAANPMDRPATAATVVQRSPRTCITLRVALLCSRSPPSSLRNFLAAHHRALYATVLPTRAAGSCCRIGRFPLTIMSDEVQTRCPT